MEPDEKSCSGWGTAPTTAMPAATGIKQVISRGGGPFAIANHYVRRVDAEQTFTQQHERVIAIQSRDIVNRHHQRA